VYKHFKTNEIVFEEDAQEFVLDQLGMPMKPLDKHGTLTQLQVDFIGEFMGDIIEWFFSDWVKDKVKDETEIDYEAAMRDKIYEENLDRKLGVL
jgi:hypothetical protein